MQETLLDGFVIGGFRSFAGSPQYIGPLGGMSVFAGHNNSGKSNVLLAAQRVISVLQSPGSALAVTGLDVPNLADDAAPPVIGVGIKVGLGEERVEAAIARLPEPTRIGRGTNIEQAFKAFLFAPALSPRDADPDLIWVRYSPDERGVMQPDQTHASQIADSMGAVGGDATAVLANALFQRTEGTPAANLAPVLRLLLETVRLPPVVLIPATRAIVSSAGSAEAPDPTGMRLPQLLESLQAPSATRYRQDKARFERINRFVRSVTERDNAEVGVPHDSETVHVGFGDLVLPLENLGSGVSQVVLLATLATWYDYALVGIEEPESHLHPVLLRRLLRYLREETTNQYLITTHAAHVLDDPAVTVYRVTHAPESGTSAHVAMTPAQRGSVAQHLGYRASDLLQANMIVWVEGPSDRIYLNAWLQAAAPELLEGVHYSVMFYGGRLLAHLTGEEMQTLDERMGEFIDLLKINRNMAIVIDSDKRRSEDALNATKVRVHEEFQQVGVAWVTEGREIESYVPVEVLAQAVKEVHPRKANEWKQPTSEFDAPFAGIESPNKVGIAERVVAHGPEWSSMDLTTRVRDLVRFIRDVNTLEPPVLGDLPEATRAE